MCIFVELATLRSRSSTITNLPDGEVMFYYTLLHWRSLSIPILTMPFNINILITFSFYTSTSIFFTLSVSGVVFSFTSILYSSKVYIRLYAHQLPLFLNLLHKLRRGISNTFYTPHKFFIPLLILEICLMKLTTCFYF